MSRAVPLLRESRGAIINFASLAAIRAVANLGATARPSRRRGADPRHGGRRVANGVRVNAVAPDDRHRAELRSRDPAAVKW